jgi:hypothetical protein
VPRIPNGSLFLGFCCQRACTFLSISLLHMSPNTSSLFHIPHILRLSQIYLGIIIIIINIIIIQVSCMKVSINICLVIGKRNIPVGNKLLKFIASPDMASSSSIPTARWHPLSATTMARNNCMFPCLLSILLNAADVFCSCLYILPRIPGPRGYLSCEKEGDRKRGVES